VTVRPDEAADIALAREILADARVVLVLTGAGISAESGVPTFRGPEGLWRSFRPEDLATPEAFERDPRLVWEWYHWRRQRVAPCVPNAAHGALARWQALPHSDVRIATQNVDGLHSLALEAAGASVDAGTLLEVHGALYRSRCTACSNRSESRDAPDATGAGLPECPVCGGLLRPDVVWFGEALDPAVIGRAFEWAAVADTCLVVGTSALVHPAASLPAVTRERGGHVVEVNPERTPLTSWATASVRGRAAEIVPAIVPRDG
jgi:NAD-dependent deacetylase